MIMWAPSWGWIDAANVLLGANQAFAWSMTVIMKVDLVGPTRRGLALGLNEFAGYLSVALSALATGYIADRYSLPPEPFYYGGVVAIVGLLLSVLFVRETRGHVAMEVAQTAQRAGRGARSFVSGGLRADDLARPESLGRLPGGAREQPERRHVLGALPALLRPVRPRRRGDRRRQGSVPGVWGGLQVVTGPLSDRIGRKGLIAGGMVVQAGGIWLTVLVPTYPAWVAGAVLQGLGTAMVYPTLLAVIGDVAHPSWRATSYGVYRLWRDLGYAVGAARELVADWLGMAAAIHVVATLTLLSGIVVLLRMRETLGRVR